MGRARDMAELMLDLYLDGQLDEVYVLFTKMVSSFQMEPTAHKLLPLDPDVFPEYEKNRDSYNRDVVYVPSVKAVMDRAGARLCKGRPVRRTGGVLLLRAECPHDGHEVVQRQRPGYAPASEPVLQPARQAAITQEITEVVGGAQAAL